MSAPGLIRALDLVSRLFEDLGVPYLIGGSVASSALGVARTTLDVDMVADLHDQHVDAFVTGPGDAFSTRETTPLTHDEQGWRPLCMRSHHT